MNILILGASGYLGKKLIHYLSSCHNITGAYRHIPVFPQPELIKQVNADRNSIQKELCENNYEWVINCAGSYEREDTKIHQLVDANLIFALDMLDCAVECGIRKFLTIDTSLPRDLNLYSFAKKSFAQFGEFYAKKYGITFINVSLEMFYGEDEPKDRFLPNSCRKMLKGETLKLTEGTQRRDIIHIDDVCNAIGLLLNSSITGFCNVPCGSGEAVTIRELIEYMHQVINSKSTLDFGSVPMRENEPDCMADITLLRSMGYEPRYSWQQGLERLCKEM